MQPVEGTHETGGSWLSAEGYAERMGSFTHTSFRFQALQVYGIPREQTAFREFTQTGTYAVARDDPRLVRLRERLTEGRRIQRVQVVVPPVSDYLWHAFVYFRHSVAAGEDLRVFDTRKTSADGLPDFDFVLLDDRTVIKLHYAVEDGSVVGRELMPDADLDVFRAYRDRAMSDSVPFSQFEAEETG